METVSDSAILPFSFSLTGIITPAILWPTFLIVLGIFSVLSAILLYHWREYALNEVVAKKAIKIYFSVSAVFILLLLVSLLLITFRT